MVENDSHFSKSVDWLRHIFSSLRTTEKERFAGLGLILYYPPAKLPVLPLVQPPYHFSLPTSSLTESVELLQMLCQADSPFHDGFHLADACSLRITHVSQYFAPQISNTAPDLKTTRPIGARFLSAWLGSLLPGIQLTAILSKGEGGIVFRRGTVQQILSPEGHEC
jgi:hypothetical protein